jgi:superfamily I DNA/RNA helicase
MEGTWWRQRQELDDEQEAIISLPFDGRFLIVGPPGCGKTNLLLLRAAFMAKSGFQDQRVLTFGGVLSSFINTGKKELDSNQISTFASWAQKLCWERLDNFGTNLEAAGTNLSSRARFVAQRALVGKECLRALNTTGYAEHLHEALHVDEVQDLMKDELRAVVKAAPRVTIAGDIRQSIYHGDAMDLTAELGFETKKLTTHYRIGKKIARVADRLHPPANPALSLEATTKARIPRGALGISKSSRPV